MNGRAVVAEVTIRGLETTPFHDWEPRYMPGNAHLYLRSLDGHLYGYGDSQDRSIVPGDHVEYVGGWWHKVEVTS
jgi:hypothetical protein